MRIFCSVCAEAKHTPLETAATMRQSGYLLGCLVHYFDARGNRVQGSAAHAILGMTAAAHCVSSATHCQIKLPPNKLHTKPRAGHMQSGAPHQSNVREYRALARASRASSAPDGSKGEVMGPVHRHAGGQGRSRACVGRTERNR